MSNKEADLVDKFVDGTLRQVERGQHEEEKGPAIQSSSSSDGSNEPQQNLTQSVTSILQRPPQVMFDMSTCERSIQNLEPVNSITQSQQAATNFLPSGTREAEAATTAGIRFPIVENGTGVNQNQLTLFPLQQTLNHSSLQSAITTGSTSSLQLINNPLVSPASMTTTRNGSSFATQPHHQMEPFGYQSMFGQTQGQGIGIHLNGGSTNNVHPFQLPNMTFQNQKRIVPSMGLSLPLQPQSMPLLTNSNATTKVTWQDNMNPPLSNLHPLNLLSQGQGTQAQSFNFPFNIRFIRNTVYDPIYEAMGLPVDPHLRMFVRRDNDGDDE